MILGLTGQKQSGKDTVAAYLIKEHGFERRAFADPLKRSVAALFDIPYHKIDQWKNQRKCVIRLATPEGDIKQTTFREFLQRYGTESHREIFSDDFWLDYTLPTDDYYTGKKLVITDCRFENEAKRIRHCDGFVVSILRPGLSLQDQHRSETPLPKHCVDFWITNDSTIQNLYEGTERMLYTLAEKDYQVRAMHGGN